EPAGNLTPTQQLQPPADRGLVRVDGERLLEPPGRRTRVACGHRHLAEAVEGAHRERVAPDGLAKVARGVPEASEVRLEPGEVAPQLGIGAVALDRPTSPGDGLGILCVAALCSALERVDERQSGRGLWP